MEFIASNKKTNFKECLAKTYSPESIYIFCDVSWIDQETYSGLRFVIVSNNNKNLVASASAIRAKSSTHTEINTLSIALEYCKTRNNHPEVIFSYCISVVEMVKSCNLATSWSFQPILNDVKSQLANFPEANLECIH